MDRHSATRVVIQCILTVGIILTLLLAGGAPSDFPKGSAPTTVLVAG